LDHSALSLSEIKSEHTDGVSRRELASGECSDSLDSHGQAGAEIFGLDSSSSAN
jgi:hypothetical protein